MQIQMDSGESLINNNRTVKSHQQRIQLENHGGLYVTSVFIKHLLESLKNKTVVKNKFTNFKNKVNF